MSIADRYHKIWEGIQEKALACGRQPEDLTLIVVSKTFPIEFLQAVYQEGARQFGESRLQEALQKIPQMPPDCRWHMIGTLQSNKVSKAISSFHLIHSVDTPVLAQNISRASEARGKTTSILLQVNTSGERTKQGLNGDEWQQALETVNQLPYLSIEGLMTMAPYIEDERAIRLCFRRLKQLQDSWRSQMKDPAAFRHLSMGMSHDYLIAIEEGATMLRIGSAIFGTR